MPPVSPRCPGRYRQGRDLGSTNAVVFAGETLDSSRPATVLHPRTETSSDTQQSYRWLKRRSPRRIQAWLSVARLPAKTTASASPGGHLQNLWIAATPPHP